MSYGYFALAFRQKYIKRWGLMKNSEPESLTEHISETAMIAHALAVIGNTYFGKHYDCNKVVTLALFHDVTEVYTGDMPTPVKYLNEELKSSYKKIESTTAGLMAEKLPVEMQLLYQNLMVPGEADRELMRLVKTSDRLCALIKCIDEEKSGNKDFVCAKVSILESLKDYCSDELTYFMKHFLDAFTWTLDELMEKGYSEKE